MEIVLVIRDYCESTHIDIRDIIDYYLLDYDCPRYTYQVSIIKSDDYQEDLYISIIIFDPLGNDVQWAMIQEIMNKIMNRADRCLINCTVVGNKFSLTFDWHPFTYKKDF